MTTRRPDGGGPDGGGVDRSRTAVPHHLDVDREEVERGLAGLVLTIVELLRQLMERQAIRRIEQGDLDDDQIENLGLTLMALEDRMTELREHFGLSPEDLNLDLGPLGPLLPRDLPRQVPGAVGARPAGPGAPSERLGRMCTESRPVSVRPPEVSHGSAPSARQTTA